MKTAYSITASAISFVLDGKMKVVNATNPQFSAVKAALKKPEHDMDELRELCDLKTFIAKATFGKVQVAENEVRYNGNKVHGVLADRLLELLLAGDDLEPIGRFMDNVMQNPIVEAQETLFTWLERGNMPITPDGCFIAFKKVRDDYKDHHSRTVTYTIGTTVEKKIDGVPKVLGGMCGHALHFCSYDYLPQFGNHISRVLLVQINPKHVVGIDRSETTKGQTTSMYVLSEMPQEDLKRVVVGKNVYDAPPLPAPKQKAEPKQELTQAAQDVRDTILAGTSVKMADFADAVNVGLKTTRNEPIVTNGGDPMVPGTEFASTTVRATETQPADATAAPVSGGRAPKPKAGAATTPISAKDDGNMAVSTTKKGKLSFTTSDGTSFTEAQVRKAFKEGVRAGARALGIAKSTFQGWVAKLA